MRRRTEPRETADDSTLDETLSGLGIWTGLMPVADAIHAERSTEYGKRAIVARIDRLFERYQWFTDRIDRPRGRRRCTRILSEPPRSPGAWARALVELSLIGTTEARVFLETWEPPVRTEDDLDLDLFRRICAAKCGR